MAYLNKQDATAKTYVDDRGVERYRGSNNRVTTSSSSGSSSSGGSYSSSSYSGGYSSGGSSSGGYSSGGYSSGSSSGGVNSSGNSSGSVTPQSWQNSRTKNPDGTYTQTFNRDGKTYTWVQDSNGKLLSQTVKAGTTPGLNTSNIDNSKRTSTVTTSDGKSYTFSGSDWVSYAKDNNINSPLTQAITYPSYTNSESAWAHMNETADRYGMDLSKPTSAYGNAVSKEYATQNNLIQKAMLNTAPKQQNLPSMLPRSLNVSPVSLEQVKATSAYQPFDYSSYFDNARKSYADSVEAQRNAMAKEYALQGQRANAQYDTAAQEAYLANYFANKKAAEQLKEAGVKSGLTESSLLRGNANFENAYNQNEQNRMKAIQDLALAEAQQNAQLDASLNEQYANLALNEMQAGQAENSALNNYNWNAYMSALNQANADRDFLLSQRNADLNYQMGLAQLEADQRRLDAQLASQDYDRLQNEISLAYKMGDSEKLKELGYYTDTVAAELAARMREANLSGIPKATSGGGRSYSGGSSSDKYDGFTRSQLLNYIEAGYGDTPGVREAMEYYGLTTPNQGMDFNITNRTYTSPNGENRVIIGNNGYTMDDIIKMNDEGKLKFEDTGLKNGAKVIKFK